ncbi:MAG TPA: peptidoglycan editing factor PgeF [Rhodopila sp.]|uniref:peptidoglycan editing factor PgeF n=1 Tax=Rhodopila sp. TaxID=2480087 RepID=UPI002BF4758C|nr:peptidoglycan editing factor PgeF [Rhodopila sp.]HVY13870.1 peptidoglycan editing factor PgeF [Rhodopila sp.]
MAEALTVDCLQMPHGFFTRRGGVSSGPFASLNCSLSSPDDRDAVMRNRALVADRLGLPMDRLLGLRQVHGDRTVTVTDPWAVGAGEAADAMVTDRPGLALGIVTADCAPVLFADASAGVIGAAHAGWRGAVGGIIESTLTAMQRLGARVEAIAAAIGPCIGQASYEVGPDLRAEVLAHDAGHERFFGSGQRADRWQFDLAGYCAMRLQEAGVTQVTITGCDTLADEARFFSHRRRTLAQAGPIGHQISAISLP